MFQPYQINFDQGRKEWKLCNMSRSHGQINRYTSTKIKSDNLWIFGSNAEKTPDQQIVSTQQ